MSANMPGSGDVATDETGTLISADKVTGTNVYNRQGDKLGSVYDVMLNKVNGQVAYAVMSFGGFLGGPYPLVGHNQVDEESGILFAVGMRYARERSGDFPVPCNRYDGIDISGIRPTEQRTFGFQNWSILCCCLVVPHAA